MPTPVELSSDPATDSLMSDSGYDGFSLDASGEDDGRFEEISERRAQLENADILRGARAL